MLRLLTDSEWRGMGITQSVGWVHYEVRPFLENFLEGGNPSPRS